MAVIVFTTASANISQFTSQHPVALFNIHLYVLLQDGQFPQLSVLQYHLLDAYKYQLPY